MAPEKVERVLLEVPGVSMALVRGRRSSLMGEMVEALVVPDPSVLDHGLLEGAIFEQCRNSLVRPAVPAVVNVVEALPLTPAGKLRRFDENGIS